MLRFKLIVEKNMDRPSCPWTKYFDTTNPPENYDSDIAKVIKFAQCQNEQFKKIVLVTVSMIYYE